MKEKEPKAFWNDRYSSREFIYGTEANAFFKEQLDKLEPGKLLLPAEGEGRNAVYAARQGWTVDAFDLSKNARDKAFALAEKYDVSLNYQMSDYESIQIKPQSYDALALIYAHMDESIRRKIHRKLIEGLKPGGTLILEAFSKDQLGNDSGGPQDLEMLYDLNELLEDFEKLQIKHADANEIELKEGMHHEGTASVIRILAMKPEG